MVEPDNEPSFLLKEDRILLVDWEKNKYELDFSSRKTDQQATAKKDKKPIQKKNDIFFKSAFEDYLWEL